MLGPVAGDGPAVGDEEGQVGLGVGTRALDQEEVGGGAAAAGQCTAGEQRGEALHTTTSWAPATSAMKLGIEITPASARGVDPGGLDGGRAGPDPVGAPRRAARPACARTAPARRRRRGRRARPRRCATARATLRTWPGARACLDERRAARGRCRGVPGQRTPRMTASTRQSLIRARSRDSSRSSSRSISFSVSGRTARSSRIVLSTSRSASIISASSRPACATSEVPCSS